MHLSPRLLRLVPLLVLLALGTTIAAGPVIAQDSASEQVRFGFEPTDGEQWHYRIEDERENDYAGKAPSRVQTTISEMDYRYEAQPDGTWRVHILPLKAEMLVDGTAVDNPAMQLAVGHEIVLKLDENGVATSAEGFYELFRAYERELDPEMYARLRNSTSAASMERGQLAQWNRLLDDLRGETVRIGDTWQVDDQVTLQGNPLPVSGLMRFEGWTELDGLRALKITYDYDSTGEAIAAAEAEPARIVNRRESDERAPRSNAVVRGSLLRLLIPETGQLLYETKDHVTEIPMGAIDGPRAIFAERHVYRFKPAES